MYSPDSSFMRKLKDIDLKLDCAFQGPVPGRFVITYARAVGPPASIWVVENDDGSFRKPDGRDIEVLKGSDVHKEDIKTRFQRSAKYMEEWRKKQDQALDDGIYERTKDDYIQMKRTTDRVYNREHKSMSGAFRRIEHKPKGIKAEEIGR